MLRCFIAIQLDDQERRDLHDIASDLDMTGWRSAPPDKYHVTLKFLGNVDPDDLHPLCRTIEQAAESTCSISIAGTHLSLIPNSRRPRVLAAMFKPDDAILSLVEQLKILLSDHGFAMEQRGYYPHVTLARKNRSGPRPTCPDQSIVLDHIIINTNEIALIQSILTDSGPIYQVQARFPLTTSP